MSGAELYLLGPPYILQDDRIIDIQRRKLFGLLAYLVVENRFIDRNSLAFFFWPEVNNEAARANLRRHLSHLRNVLGKDCLRLHRDQVAVNKTYFKRIDLFSFLELYEGRKQSRNRSDTAAFTQAAALYRDDFMSGLSLRGCPEFDDWQHEQAESLRMKTGEILEELVVQHEQTGDLPTALQYCQRWLSICPYEEKVHRLLMRLYYASGMRAAALKQYRRCRQMLLSEYDAEPEKATEELGRAIQGDEDELIELGCETTREAERVPSEVMGESHNSIVTVLVSGFFLPDEGDTELDAENEQLSEIKKLIQSALAQQSCDRVEMLGQDILGLFGVCTAHEDDPDRALNAALQIRKQAGLEGLTVSTAIRTGPVYITYSRKDAFSPRLLVTGTVIGLAERLRMQCERGEIRLDRATRSSCRRSYLFEEVSEKAGCETSVYVLHGSASETAALSTDRYATPFVGRRAELGQLRKSFEEASRGHGQVAVIRGGAGIGKSRMIHELIRFVVGATDRPVLCLRGQCSEFFSNNNRAAWPFIEALRNFINWREDVERDRLQIGRSLPDTDPLDHENLLHLLYENFERLHFSEDEERSLDTSKPDSGRLAQKVGSFIGRILSALAKEKLVILMIEDLHWADTASLSVIGQLCDLLRNEPMLLLLSSRSEERLDLRSVQPITIELEPLSANESRRLVCSIVETAKDRDDLIEQILAHGKGIPLFLEELALAAARGSVIKGSVPLKLQKMLLSHFDLLPRELRSLLETAAIIGPVFDRNILSRIMGQVNLGQQAFHELIVRRLIFRDASGQAIQYRFRHILLQEAIYRSIPRPKRRELHLKTARAIETAYRRNLEELAAVLAYHFEQGGNNQKASEYYLIAGDRARNSLSTEDASRLYESCSKIMDVSDHRTRADVFMKLGEVYLRLNDSSRAQRCYGDGFREFQLAGEAELSIKLPKAPHGLRFNIRVPNRLNPYLLGDRDYFRFLYQLFGGLVDIDNTMRIAPRGAERWEISEDGKRYTFFLRRDDLWSDGVPVTAQDYICAFKRTLSSGYLPVFRYLSSICGAEAYFKTGSSRVLDRSLTALDDYTLKIVLERENPMFLQSLTVPCTFPIPRHKIDQYGNEWMNPEHIVTNGPFCLVHWNTSERVVLKRNESYRGLFPGNVEEVTAFPEKDGSREYEMYLNGELDFHYPSPQCCKAAWREAPEEIHMLPTTCTDMLVFNPNREPIADPKLRQALCLALDINQFRECSLQYARCDKDIAFFSVARGGMLPAGHPAHNPGINCAFDPILAKNLFDQVGLKRTRDGPLFTMTVPAELHWSFPNLIQNQWARHVGIEIDIEKLQWDDYLECANRFDYQVLFFRFAFYASDTMGWLPPGLEIWEDEGFKNLKTRFETSAKVTDQISLVKEIDRRVVENNIILPCSYLGQLYLSKPWIKLPPQWQAAIDHFKYAVVLPH